METLKEFWDNRYQSVTVQESGNRGYSLRYNRWYYKAKERALHSAAIRNKISLKGKRIADVGCGTGYFIDLFLKFEPAFVLGIDLSEKSADHLTKRFSSRTDVAILCSDIARLDLSRVNHFDLVNAFDLMYLIVDEKDSSSAINNLCSLVKQGGVLFIVDMFPVRDVFLSDYIVCRSLDWYQGKLRSQGLEVVDLVPQFLFFNREFSSLPQRLVYDFLPGAVYLADLIGLRFGLSGDGNRSGASFRLLVARRV